MLKVICVVAIYVFISVICAGIFMALDDGINPQSMDESDCVEVFVMGITWLVWLPLLVGFVILKFFSRRFVKLSFWVAGFIEAIIKKNY